MELTKGFFANDLRHVSFDDIGFFVKKFFWIIAHSRIELASYIYEIYFM